MKLYRPYVPLAVRVLVAERQLGKIGWCPTDQTCALPLGERLFTNLRALFGDAKSELHHRPALCNRRRYVRNGKVFYDPPANDPAHLVYLADDEHDIETRVRGVGAQRSDLGQARYNKKVARNREKRVPRPKQAVSRKASPGSSGFPISSDKSKPKRKWASRPLQSASRWRKRPLKDAGRKVPYDRPRKTPVTLPRLSMQDDRS